ncbi:metal-dependent hydrolase [Serpentinicella sp. ANB-PHB4]|uniref:metal-dependent hydrolase n=1 Tax=Serpentinicella sp. ANB-PHB4 TaxID=3074076 RepID=UPI0028667B0E|nr:metal-dependent hydrolase [Serpentinicella sp. ANB-PHB4]MDR5659436.1 metal-dependent hydrolase [Serpentinicella sp. ANB-PHB4]
MLGRTHVALGMTMSLIIIILISAPIYFDNNLIAISVVLIGALLPDLDMGNGTLSNKFGIFKEKHIRKVWLFILGLLAIVAFIFFRTTTFFYGIILILFLGFLMSESFAKKGYRLLRSFVQALVAFGFIAAAYHYRHFPLIWVGVILLILLISKHRGFSHSLIFAALTILAVRHISLFYGEVDYSVIFGASIISHIIGDMFTRGGVKLFLPFSQKRKRFPLTIKTGGKLENIVFIIACIITFTLTRKL